MAVRFDTHAEVKMFKSAGLTEEQDEVVGYVIRNSTIAECPTKSVTTDAVTGMKEALRDFERRLTIRVGAMIVLWGLVIVAAIKLLP